MFFIIILLVSCNDYYYQPEDTIPEYSINEIRITLPKGLSLLQINNGKKETKYYDNIISIVNENGSVEKYSNCELKGRGNFTWDKKQMLKKPYQIKFEDKVNVFDMGSAKKWILLANYADGSLIKNKLAFDLANLLEMPFTPESSFANLYVNDKYLGNYLITEKIEVGKSRVNLKDDYGILCEIDGNYGTNEDIFFKTPIKRTVIVYSDSVADDLEKTNSKAREAFSSICSKITTLESLLNNSNTKWTDIEPLIDVESFIKYYFIQELVEDPDGLRSSLYIWSDGKADVLHIGPV